MCARAAPDMGWTFFPFAYPEFHEERFLELDQPRVTASERIQRGLGRRHSFLVPPRLSGIELVVGAAVFNVHPVTRLLRGVNLVDDRLTVRTIGFDRPPETGIML